MEAILILDKLSCRPCAQQDVRPKGPSSLSTQTQGDNQQPFSSLDSFSGSLSLPSAVTIFSQSGLQWDPIIPQLRSQKIKRNTAQRPRVLSAVCNWASPAVRGSCYVTRNCRHCALWDNNGNVMALPNQGRWLPLCTCLQQGSTSSSTEERTDSSGSRWDGDTVV